MTAIGNLYIVAAPSGAGKTSLVKALVASLPGITVSISHTTRAKRPGEEDGINYHFVTREMFNTMIQHGEFLEYATIFDRLYGTSKSWVEETLVRGMDVILEIDWQGHQQIKWLFPQSISVFILPPSQQALSNRLINRNQDSQAVIQQRLADVVEAVSHANEFDYLIVNDDFNQALADLKKIVEVGRLTQKRQQIELKPLLTELLDSKST